MAENTEQDNVKRFSFKGALERGEYFRRECDQCGRQFKMKVDPDSLAYTLAPTFKRIGLEVGARSHDQSQEPSLVYCPYCGYEGKANGMLTLLFLRYLYRRAQREVLLPMIRDFQSSLENSIGSRRSRSRSSFSVEISFKSDPVILPPQPISGPELTDMIPVHLLCCDNYAKVLDSYSSTIICPFCGVEASLQ